MKMMRRMTIRMTDHEDKNEIKEDKNDSENQEAMEEEVLPRAGCWQVSQKLP